MGTETHLIGSLSIASDLIASATIYRSLPAPRYVTASYGVEFQMSSADQVEQWALWQEASMRVSHSDGKAYYRASFVYEDTDFEVYAVISEPSVPGLAEHTAAAQEKIIEASMGTGQVADDDEESLIFADESEYAE
jgi:hypothetical protein